MTPAEHYQATHKTVNTETVKTIINGLRNPDDSWEIASYNDGKIVTLFMLNLITSEEYVKYSLKFGTDSFNEDD